MHNEGAASLASTVNNRNSSAEGPHREAQINPPAGVPSQTRATRRRYEDLADRRFNRLTVIAPAGNRKGRKLWLCKCDCGNERIATADALKRSQVTCCTVCARETKKAAHTTHGQYAGGKASPTLNSFRQAKRRCEDPKDRDYPRYGGAGIKFRFKSVEQLIAEIGLAEKGDTLERIDRNGHYEPGNVSWEDRKQQAFNRRTTIPVTINGQTMCLNEATKRLGKRGNLVRWLRRNVGLSPQQAVNGLCDQTQVAQDEQEEFVEP